MGRNRGLRVTEIFKLEPKTELRLPLFISRMPAGFPSPASDYVEQKLDLNEYLIKHPAATYFVRVEGDSMINAGIFENDVLIVDRALEARNNDVVVAVLNGELTVKRIHYKNDRAFLIADNPDYNPMEITPEMDFNIWGVVTYVIHKP
ncbi:MAG: LexA family protein [Thermodesulfobacteriota bacterium]